MMHLIRPVRANELELLRTIEHDACRAFAEVGMPEIAADEPASVEELERFRTAGDAWVAVNAVDEPIAYLLGSPLDGGLHIEQVSVRRAHSGQRLGAALVGHLEAVAVGRRAAALTLTTFRDVPWNAPYYARLGFEVLRPEELGPELRDLVAEELASIPGDATRVAMRRWCPPPTV